MNHPPMTIGAGFDPILVVAHFVGWQLALDLEVGGGDRLMAHCGPIRDPFADAEFVRIRQGDSFL